MNEFLDSAKQIGIFIAEVIVALFFCKQYLNKYFKKTNVGKMLPKQNKLDLEILNKLEYVKEILNADRIHVYEFHNGEHYSDYRSAYKFSCTYEVFKAGNHPVQQRCINLPTNCMPQFIHKITEDGRFVCNDLEALKEEKEKLASSIARREKLLANENYVQKAPSHVVEQDRIKLKEEQERLAFLSKQIEGNQVGDENG